MKALTLLKCITTIMTVLIIVGLFLVLHKITDFSPKSKFLSSTTTEFRLFQSEEIQQILPCGEKLCLYTIGQFSPNRLIIINPDSGRIQHILEFHREAVKN